MGRAKGSLISESFSTSKKFTHDSDLEHLFGNLSEIKPPLTACSEWYVFRKRAFTTDDRGKRITISQSFFTALICYKIDINESDYHSDYSFCLQCIM